MLALSLIYALAGHVPLIDALFFGLKSAVLVLVVEALLRIGRRALKGQTAWALAAVAFVALFVFKVPFPAMVLAAGLVGYLFPDRFSHAGHGAAKHDRPALIDAVLDADPGRPARLAASARKAGAVALVLWAVPVAYLVFATGGTFADIAWFFSKMAVVTIGGAYAVLAYVAQDAVEAYRWLAPDEMLAGLGLAETTPGPLILVLQYVGFYAGWHNTAGLDPTVAAIIASALATFCTFLPSFLFVLAPAPYIHTIHESPALGSVQIGRAHV